MIIQINRSCHEQVKLAEPVFSCLALLIGLQLETAEYISKLSKNYLYTMCLK